MYPPKSLPPEVFGTILNLYVFKQSNFVAACTDGLHIAVSYDNNLKIFPGDVCSRAPLSSNVSSKRAHPFVPILSFRRNIINHPPNNVLLISKKLKHQKNVF
jgi:hypothetical protein